MHLIWLRSDLRLHDNTALAAATRRCHDCDRAAKTLTEVREPDGTVVWLGPGCHRRRAERGQADALPIGGTP